MSKKFFIQMTVCTAFFIFILIFSSKESVVANYSDLNKIVDVISKHNGSIEEWSILAREEFIFSKADMDNTVKNWRKSFPHLNWSEQLNQERVTIIGTSSNEENPYVETVQLISEKKGNQFQGFILYERKGENWNEHVQEMIDERNRTILPDVFHKTPSFFSCIKGEFDGMIDKALLEKSIELQSEFNGKIVENLVENDFVSLTVNSPQFKEKIPTKNGSFNLQISLRNTGNDNKTTFVIGTPILTIEY
ncbi:YwmB family TATA-box binding protein [Bacillus andreraoultii]|uniref:YwmB family TATA-box binding protein n=1 Tax=Bacillus andreraoultii TaxID=1499685 RepID=UPI00067EF989|nr:YwmB family TATA-box binding protein [Bacillus andreraoultii]